MPVERKLCVQNLPQEIEGGELRLEKFAGTEKQALDMEWGNRVCHLPVEVPLKGEEETRATGLLCAEPIGDTDLAVIPKNSSDRLPRVPRLWKHGKVIQIVGGNPDAMGFIRPAGVDEVWVINPRPYWPREQAPDLIITRDYGFLFGPDEQHPTFVTWGIEALLAWPGVPIVVASDTGYCVAERTIHGKYPCPPHIRGDNRAWFELNLHNLFDTAFSALSGFSVGLALATARHAGATVVLTGIGGMRSEEMYAQIGGRGYKTADACKREDVHITQEVVKYLSRFGGRSAYVHGPVCDGQHTAPEWPGR